MIPRELERLIEGHKSQGHLPFFVNCTTGSTVYGAFDPIEDIADICEKHHIWLHIDVSFKDISYRKQEEIALSAGVQGKGSKHNGDGTNGYGVHQRFGVHHGYGVHHEYGVYHGYGAHHGSRVSDGYSKGFKNIASTYYRLLGAAASS